MLKIVKIKACVRKVCVFEKKKASNSLEAL